MVEAGEGVKFIARRMLISASEDIGNANPTALILQEYISSSCYHWLSRGKDYFESVCSIFGKLTKSNASYIAIKKVQESVRQTGDLSVPLHLRNSPTT